MLPASRQPPSGRLLVLRDAGASADPSARRRQRHTHRRPLGPCPGRQVRRPPAGAAAGGIFSQVGMALSRSTLTRRVYVCGVQLQPFADALKRELLLHLMVHIDETPVAMLWPRNGKTHRCGATAARASRVSAGRLAAAAARTDTQRLGDGPRHPVQPRELGSADALLGGRASCRWTTTTSKTGLGQWPLDRRTGYPAADCTLGSGPPL